MEWLVVRCTAYFSLFDDRNTAVMQPSVAIGIWLLFISSEILCSKTNDSYKLTVPPNYLFTSVLSFLFFFCFLANLNKKKNLLVNAASATSKTLVLKIWIKKEWRNRSTEKVKKYLSSFYYLPFFSFFLFFFVWKGFFFVVVVLAKLLK